MASHSTAITLETVLDDYESTLFLERYLSLTRNVEPLHFIQQVNDYSSLHSHHNRYVKAREMIDGYVRSQSKSELNIASDVRQEIIQLFDTKCSLYYCPKLLFDRCVSLVMLELKEDVWPRYIKSLEYRQWYEGVYGSTTELEAVPNAGEISSPTNQTSTSDGGGSEFNVHSEETGSDECLDRITFSTASAAAYLKPDDNENNYGLLSSAETFDAQLNLVKEWSFGTTLRGEELKLTQKTSQYECYVTKRGVKFNEEDKALKMWKLRLNLNHSIDTVFRSAVMASLRNANDGNLYESYQVDSYQSYDPRYAITVTRELYRFGYGFTDRDAVFAHTAREEVNEKGRRRIIIVSRGIKHEKEPVYSRACVSQMAKQGGRNTSSGSSKLKRFIRLEVIATRIFEEVEDNRTYYYETGYMDMKGNVPAFLWNILVGKRGATLYAGVSRSCKRFEKMIKENPNMEVDSLGTIQIVEHNRKYMANLKKQKEEAEQELFCQHKRTYVQ